LVAIVYSEKFLQHETGMHPERKERLIAIIDFLQKKGFQQFNKPLEIDEKELLLVHQQSLITDVKRLSSEAISTGDNVFNKNTFGIALLACGAALKAAELSEKGFAFSLARPPGHHAGSNFFGGFCYFNNIAFAVRAMQRSKGIGRAMIVDFDLHCGNGTEEIFYNDKSVFYLSLHQDPAFTFPGTGFESENNSHIRNVPLEAGLNDRQYLRLFEKNFTECFDLFQPQLLAVSAGFDIFASDAGIVGAQLAVEKHATFNTIGKVINWKAKEKGVPCFAVLEGGYDLTALPLNVFNFLNAFE
jgi:acetoin utilization deacetylase AcuC-like enzyme